MKYFCSPYQTIPGPGKMIVKIGNNTMLGVVEPIINQESSGSGPEFNLGCLRSVFLYQIEEKIDKKIFGSGGE